MRNKKGFRLKFVSVVLATLALNLPLFTEVSTVQAQESKNSANASGFYKKAKQELSPDLYTLYRIIDRIARANDMADHPWRIAISPQYQINAFATEVNLIAMYTGLLDQLAGDASAIACVVGHEMAHHEKKHIAKSPAEQVALRQTLKQEAETEALAEIEEANSDITGTAIGASVLRGLGGFLGGTPGSLSHTGGSMLEAESRNRAQEANLRVQEILKEKEQKLAFQLAQTSRTHELEADEMGYKLMATAGFEAEGCLRVMQVLSRLPSAEFDTTHPAIPKRTARLKELMQQYPAENLATLGKRKLYENNQPLTYNRSSDRRSLRINSQRGGSSAEDIDRMFGL